MQATAWNGIPAPEMADAIVDGMRFRTETATLLAYHWLRGAERLFFSNAKRVHLFRTPKGNYFCQEQETPEASEFGNSFGHARIRPLTPERAVEMYSRCEKRFVPVELAFPGMDIDG
jgi:hypothetical protein